MVSLHVAQRLSVAVVRDCGLFPWPLTQIFMRGRMFDLPLKPLLLLHFVMGMVFISLTIFLYYIQYLKILL